jgi:hypothetical protein
MKNQKLNQDENHSQEDKTYHAHQYYQQQPTPFQENKNREKFLKCPTVSIHKNNNKHRR